MPEDPNYEKAKQLRIEAIYKLGMSYKTGDQRVYEMPEGSDVSYDQALKWLRLAADENYTDAQYELGDLYSRGLGVSENPEEANRLFGLAAQKGLARAQNQIGLRYKQGIGVAKDENMAFQWFSSAAEQNYAPALFNVGLCYAEGIGLSEKNDSTAFEYFRRAAEQGNVSAQYELGVRYAEGTGVRANSRKAREWLTKAGNAGNEQARARLELLRNNK